MAEIITAKNCGFCLGVRKAVDKLLDEMAKAENFISIDDAIKIISKAAVP